MRIVLVDLSRTIVRIVSELVAADGHEALGFTDGRKALACLDANADVRASRRRTMLPAMAQRGARRRPRLIARGHLFYSVR